MPDLRLRKLPNRNRAKLLLDLWPELDDRLRRYAALHAQRYGEEVSAADIAPYMLEDFMSCDREFQKSLRTLPERGGGG